MWALGVLCVHGIALESASVEGGTLTPPNPPPDLEKAGTTLAGRLQLYRKVSLGRSRRRRRVWAVLAPWVAGPRKRT